MQKFLRKILEILRKLNTPLTYTILSAALGLSLLFLPPPAAAILFSILGGVLALFGAAGLILTLSDNTGGLIRTLSTIKYLVFIAIGASLILGGAYISPSLTHALGLGLSAWMAAHIFALHHRLGQRGIIYYVDVVLSSILAVFGVLLLITPSHLYTLTGITLLFLSVKLGLGIYTERASKEKAEQEDEQDGVYYIDNFVDKSDE